MANTTLLRAGNWLADPAHQLHVLQSEPTAVGPPRHKPFEDSLAASGLYPLRALGIEVLQVNVGKLCNMTCAHCHVDAGPDRREMMTCETAEACIAALAKTDIPTLDLTGGAPEMVPSFRWLVEEACKLGRHVIDRSNLTILLAPGYRDLPEFLAEHQVEIVASLPCYLEDNVDAQRGDRAFARSIEALGRLNRLGYGRESGLTLTLVSGAGREIAEQPPEESEPKQANLLGTLLLAGLAVLITVAAGYAYLNAELIGRLFGPPAVIMEERYQRRPDGPVFDHSALSAILEQHVNDNGGVDYAALIADPEPLRRYNASLAEAPFDALGRDEKLALLINAYNSFTLELMIEWLPRDGIAGIRDIPADRRWDDRRWNIGGHIWSLNEIEHEQIRPHFVEPRIHWAVVCAAVGCPPLRTEAYVGERLDEQLAEQERIIHTDGSRWFRFDAGAGVVHLTQLYNWYGGDFEQVAGSVLDYVAQHAPAVREAIEQGRQLRTEWLHYDWSLNNQENLR